ncbi:DUF2585 family protein [Candidatus Pacearchaeota archaeon]|nr:DUF2585 family protein [Candidatus Pacearchaeota archaeon]
MNLKKSVDNLKKYYDNHLWVLILVAVLIILAMGLIEYLMGRLVICKCNYVLFWYNNVNGPGNSQHLFDWYSFSHIIHGMFYYFLLRSVAKRLPVKTRFLFALLIETSWEVFENSPFIINRYRTATFALDYYGDSIINSVFDVFSMGLGFILARKLPPWLTATLAIALELFTLYMIRDNLALNILNLIYPTESVKDWQTAGTNMKNMSLLIFLGVKFRLLKLKIFK